MASSSATENPASLDRDLPDLAVRPVIVVVAPVANARSRLRAARKRLRYCKCRCNLSSDEFSNKSALEDDNDDVSASLCKAF